MIDLAKKDLWTGITRIKVEGLQIGDVIMLLYSVNYMHWKSKWSKYYESSNQTRN